jgi:methylthioribulose-1-phosphate dehydratase
MKEKLALLIRELNAKGWSPATSTNYSFVDDGGNIWISKSGVDKAYFNENDFMQINLEGVGIGIYAAIKPSAETLIHTKLYQLFPEIKVILHSHSVYPVVLSSFMDHSVRFSDYEVQKGFKGQVTHDALVEIPVFDNTQDILAFQNVLEENKTQLGNSSFIMRKHGTYAWGIDLFEAKRHLETLDYLCQCELLRRSY